MLDENVSPAADQPDPQAVGYTKDAAADHKCMPVEQPLEHPVHAKLGPKKKSPLNSRHQDQARATA
eukprot:900620-Pelagomonas_calceolata.AAC.1